MNHDGPSSRLAMCDGKDPLTWAQAIDIINRQSNRDRRRSMYHCRFCRAWHVGRKPRKIRLVGAD